jgi:hypothetical protein
MPPLPFRFAAETYTWFMKESGRAYAGKIPHMINVTARAGYAEAADVADADAEAAAAAEVAAAR